MATHPLELVHLDYLCLELWEGKRGKCPGGGGPLDPLCPGICHPIPDCPDNSQGPLGQLCCSLWDPKEILSDQGRNFKSELIADLGRLMGTKKLRTSLHHSQTTGQCERFNSTLIGMLGTLPPECISDWKGSIGVLIHTYNCN